MPRYAIHRPSQEPMGNVLVFPSKAELPPEKMQLNLPTPYEFSAIVNASSDGVMVLDASGRILWANQRAQELFVSGNGVTDLLNTPFYTLFSGESRGVAHQYFASLRAGTVPSLFHSGQCIAAHNNQTQRFLLRMTLGVLCDMPERFFLIVRPEEQEIKSSSGEKGQGSDLTSKDTLSLLAHVTHEMRTPLVSIVGFSEMLLEDRLRSPERVEEYMTYIYKASQHVLALVNEILEVQNFQNGQTSTPFTVLNLPALMRECVALMGPQAFENHITLQMEGPEKIEIYGHARSLRQIFLNLLSNGVKFTDPGGTVVLSCAAIEKGRVRISCRDTGIGMTSDQIDSVLKGQVQSTWKERRGGMGLGLMLTQQLVAAHKGSFSIRSEKENGTCIEIILPLQREDVALARAEEVLLPA